MPTSEDLENLRIEIRNLRAEFEAYKASQAPAEPPKAEPSKHEEEPARRR